MVTRLIWTRSCKVPNPYPPHNNPLMEEYDLKIGKVISVSILLLFTVIFLTSCSKIVNEEYVDVEATITDTYYRPSYITPMIAGKVTTFVTHPAVHSVTVEYEGVEYRISGSSFYDEHKDDVGKSVKVVCHKIHYDDGSIRQTILEGDSK